MKHEKAAASVPPRILHSSPLSERLLTLYSMLANHFAHEPHWWPIFTRQQQFEVMIGAVLVQQTRWEAVEGAIQRLIARDWLGPAALAAADTEELAQIIRPCAFHTQKAPGLQAIARYLLNNYAGDPAPMFAKDRRTLREELLALPRVGPETADTMMVYAGQHPVFIVDAYARRLFHRVDILPGFDVLRAPYDQVQQLVEERLEAGGWKLVNLPASSLQPPASNAFYREFHALITEACIHHCLTKPRCDLPGLRRRPFLDPRKCAEHCLVCGGCPLRDMCHTYQEQRTKN